MPLACQHSFPSCWGACGCRQWSSLSLNGTEGVGLLVEKRAFLTISAGALGVEDAWDPCGVLAVPRLAAVPPRLRLEGDLAGGPPDVGLDMFKRAFVVLEPVVTLKA